jgi:lipopolysaccharide biosynthesis glycosyltransferase
MINIVAACDSNYAQHLSVMLASLLDCNPGERFRVFVLTSAPPDALERVRASCTGHDCEIVPVEIDPRRLAGVPIFGHVTPAGYYRLLLGEVLPQDVSRVLYVDSDIVVAGSIAGLWSLELGSNVIGAVPDEGYPSGGPAKLGLAEADRYFNSGLILIDLERWRREGTGEAALAFARSEPQRITWWDQCALNFVLRGRWMVLDRKWNLQTHAIGEFTGWEVVPSEEGRQRLRDAAVIHFTTHSKPWLYRCGHPAKARYWHYLRRTPWRNYRVPDLSARNVARKLAMRYCPSLVQAYKTLVSG